LIVHSAAIQLSLCGDLVERGLVRNKPAALEAAIEAAASCVFHPRPSALLISIYTLGLWLWNSRFALTPNWLCDARRPLDLPRRLLDVFVSIPILPVPASALVCEALHLVFASLARVQLNLHLVPIHPDHCGGLAFLVKSSYALVQSFFCPGAMPGGAGGEPVCTEGKACCRSSWRWEAFRPFRSGHPGPLLMLLPRWCSKTKGLADDGQVAQGYVKQF